MNLQKATRSYNSLIMGEHPELCFSAFEFKIMLNFVPMNFQSKDLVKGTGWKMKTCSEICEDIPLTFSDCGNGKPLPIGITRIKIYNDGKCYDQDNNYIGELQPGHKIKGEGTMKGIAIQMKLP